MKNRCWCQAGLSLFLFLLAACAANPNSAAAQQCSGDLSIAYSELDISKANGFDGTVSYVKAASLLTAAKVQEEFGRYPNCIEKVKRARAFIAKSKSG